jgi:hypothetical protein
MGRMATAKTWQQWPAAETEITAVTLNGEAIAAPVNLVRNPRFTTWAGSIPAFYGTEAGSTPAVAPVRDVTTGQGFTRGGALKWTVSAADGANALLTDIGGAIPMGYEGTTLAGSFPGITAVMRCKTSTASLVRVQIRHLGVEYSSDWHTGGGTWEDLAVTMPASVAVAAGASIYIAADFATNGGTVTAWVDDLQATPGEWHPALAVAAARGLMAEAGPAITSWTRRAAGALAVAVVADEDGVIRAGGAHVDYSPSWSSLFGVAAPEILGFFIVPHSGGTNLWSLAAMSKICGHSALAGVLTVGAQQGQTFGTAGNSLRSNLVVFFDNGLGGTPWTV